MITLDSRSRDPIYAQLEKQIIKLINLGIYEKDSALPSVRQMAVDLRINPNTVAKAYKNLEAKDILYTVAGKGVFVSDSDTKSIRPLAVENAKKVLTDAKNAGLEREEIEKIIKDIWREKADD